jgi:hypothetical protein
VVDFRFVVDHWDYSAENPPQNGKSTTQEFSQSGGRAGPGTGSGCAALPDAHKRRCEARL